MNLFSNVSEHILNFEIPVIRFMVLDDCVLVACHMCMLLGNLYPNKCYTDAPCTLVVYANNIQYVWNIEVMYMFAMSFNGCN